ncbi:Apulose-4-phosphate transketolase subunit A [subsurface metagenome]
MESFNSEFIKFLRIKAYELRQDVVDMVFHSDGRSGHFGGSMSPAEIVTTLYWYAMNIDSSRPDWEDRSRLVLSKGHSAPIIYAALAHKGYFDRAILKTYRGDDSILQGHPDFRKTPGLDMSSGSLGQGLSVALGMALGAKQAGKNFHVYALLSDGEQDEGMVWEAAMASSHYQVENLTAIVDYNHLQVNGPPSEIMNLEPLLDKWRAFGWDCLMIDGHDIPSLLSAFEIRKKAKRGPFVIICRTTKGKGVSFMENSIDWHHHQITKDLRDQALAELRQTLDELKRSNS